MDPTQALVDAIASAKESEYPYEQLDALASWLNRGGFLPNLDAVTPGDREDLRHGLIGGMKPVRPHLPTVGRLADAARVYAAGVSRG